MTEDVSLYLRDWYHGIGDNRVILVLDGRKYRRTGWFGCQLESMEWRRVPAGATREIAGQSFRVFTTDRDGLKFRTTWCLSRLPEDINKANAVLRAFDESLRRMIT